MVAGGVSTPNSGKKRRHGGENAAVNGILAAADHGTRADRQYILQWLDSRPELENFIASMLRSGTLQKAMRARTQATVAEELGRKFPPSRGKDQKRFKSLTARFRKACVLQWVGGDDDAWASVDDMVKDRLFYYALATDPKTPLPVQHDHPDFEGPMFLVLNARYKDVGSRLDGCTPELAEGWGYFAHVVATPKIVLCHLNKKNMPLNMDAVISQANDWCLLDNDTCDARLFSDTLDLGLRLCKLYEKHFGATLPKHDDAFEYPEAAKELRHLKAPQEEEDDDTSGPTTTAVVAMPSAPPQAAASPPASALALVNGRARAKPKARKAARTAAPPSRRVT